MAMKLLTGILLLVASTVQPADRVTFAWDASPSSNVAGYNVYVSYYTNAATNGHLKFDAGDNLMFKVTGLEEGDTYYSVGTAYRAGLESGPSNEIVFTNTPKMHLERDGTICWHAQPDKYALRQSITCDEWEPVLEPVMKDEAEWNMVQLDLTYPLRFFKLELVQ